MNNTMIKNDQFNKVKREFKRGEVCWAYCPELEDSQIQGGWRPIVIIANDKAGKYSPTLQYIPLTTEIKREDLPIHVVLKSGNLKETSMALGEQLNCIDTHRIKSTIGMVSNRDMYLIEMIALKQLGINVYDFMRNMKLQHVG
jgi:mRNA interferase MazF